MPKAKKLVVIGFDSISLGTLETFVRRGVMPTVKRLMERGCVTQTWPCFPMETGTNWACLATGASPWVSGCNMSVHWPGTPLNQRTSGFPASVCKAEQLWTTARRVGKRSIIFDWSQSWPLKFEDGIIHVGEDGRPDNALRALQEVRAYTTHPRQPGPHVTKVEPRPSDGHADSLEFELPIVSGPQSRYQKISSLFALVLKGPSGYDRVAVHADRDAQPLLVARLNEWTGWAEHTFMADGAPVRAGEGWALWDRLMGCGDEIVRAAALAAGPDALIALVSDHGGDTMLPGIDVGHADPNEVLRQNGWLVQAPGAGIDWTKTRAFGAQHYLYLNVKGRDPQGIVEPGDDYLRLREEIIEALLSAKDASVRHRYRVVLPMEDAGRLAVGGDRVGDIFLVPAKRHPLATVSREEFWKTHTVEQTGTWDWPRLNVGSHSDDSYFVLAGPGVKQGFRRPRPTLITSVAPTLAKAWGIPLPADADGSVLHDFLAE